MRDYGRISGRMFSCEYRSRKRSLRSCVRTPGYLRYQMTFILHELSTVAVVREDITFSSEFLINEAGTALVSLDTGQIHAISHLVFLTAVSCHDGHATIATLVHINHICSCLGCVCVSPMSMRLGI